MRKEPSGKLVKLTFEELKKGLDESFSDEEWLSNDDSLSVPSWSDETIRAYLEIFPEGSLALVGKDGLEAFAFARKWGRTGWIGPCAFRRLGENREEVARLLGECASALVKSDASVIGLEVAPRRLELVHFLASRDFIPQRIALVLEKDLESISGGEPEEETQGFSPLLEPGNGEGKEQRKRIHEAVTSVDSDLDVTSELNLFYKYSLGEVLFCRDEEAYGFALCRKKALSGAGMDALEVPLLVVNQRHPFPLLERLLGGIERVARSSGFGKVRIDALTRSWEGCKAVLDAGYRIKETFLRMTLCGYPERGDMKRINFNRWR